MRFSDYVLHFILTRLNAVRIVQDLVSEVVLEIGALYNASEAVRSSLNNF